MVLITSHGWVKHLRTAFSNVLGLAVFVGFDNLALAQRIADAPSAVFTNFRYSGSQPGYAEQKRSASQYQNPILAGSYPDPSVTRAQGQYFLATSSMAYRPGIPIFRSTDLVHWRQIGAAITRPSQLNLSGLWASNGVYAPDLKYHDGVFYLLNTCVLCGGNYILTSKTPTGSWSDPNWLPFDGIDPSIFFDDDGRAYVLNNGPPQGSARYPGHRAICFRKSICIPWR